MTDGNDSIRAPDVKPLFPREAVAASLYAPAGFQATATLASRRRLVLVLNLVTWAMLVVWFTNLLAANGWSVLDSTLLICFLFATPWSVLGFWNAVIGFLLMKSDDHGLAETAPFLASIASPDPIAIKTAVLLTLRNEDPERAFHRLRIVKDSLDATPDADGFSYFILSDSNDPNIAAEEERLAAELRDASDDKSRVVYRRRADNTGYKAGNVRDFCERWGKDHELMLPLDADSLMSGPAIVALVRIMQRYPKLGILQSLVVGTPAQSAFARIFQFGMRFGMRTYTMGQSWWTGDCGPYWGHNAVIRVAPFVQHCSLPVLPGAPPFGGHILSHDQFEATLMRKAGFEVRVMPIEGGSFEDNPPDALTFMTRDIRWCQGNLQYLKLVGYPGLLPTSRFQLVWAILMFVGIPAWTLMIALSPLVAADLATSPAFDSASAKTLYLTVLAMFLSPKIVGVIDALTRRGEAGRFGGRLKFIASAALELVFSFLLGALTALRTSIFIFTLPLGGSVGWKGQSRDGAAIRWADAIRALWPHTLFGAIVCAALYAVSPAAFFWSLPLTAGYLLAIPFAVITAEPRLGAWLRRHGIASIPEDIAPPPEIVALADRRNDRGGRNGL